MRLAERFLVADAVEDERVVELDATLDRDLGDPPAGRTEPALAHQTVTVSPGSGPRISQPVVRSRRHSSGVPVRSGNVP